MNESPFKGQFVSNRHTCSVEVGAAQRVLACIPPYRINDPMTSICLWEVKGTAVNLEHPEAGVKDFTQWRRTTRLSSAFITCAKNCGSPPRYGQLINRWDERLAFSHGDGASERDAVPYR